MTIAQIVYGILFVNLINLIILTNSTVTLFNNIDKSDYYTFILYSFWTYNGVLLEYVVLWWYGVIAAICKHTNYKTLLKQIYSSSILGPILGIVVIYIKISPIWISDPTHSIPFYNNYWSELVIKSKVDHPPNKVVSFNQTNIVTWPIIVSDVTIRFTSIFLFWLPINLVIYAMVTIVWVKVREIT